jgi:THO complex subunit 4
MLPVQAHYARLTTPHGPKRQLLGNQAGQAPPAWRNPDAARERARSQMAGSKIFISSLPTDVTELEVQVGLARSLRRMKEFNSRVVAIGSVHKDYRATDRVIHRLQLLGKVQGHGSRVFSTAG